MNKCKWKDNKNEEEKMSFKIRISEFRMKVRQLRGVKSDANPKKENYIKIKLNDIQYSICDTRTNANCVPSIRSFEIFFIL